MRRLGRSVSRLLLWLLLVLSILTALYLSAGRIVSPVLENWKPELEQLLGEQAGQPVSLGRLQARWAGFSPRLYAENVQWGGQLSALRVERLHFRPDMLQSLLQARWVLSGFVVDGVDLELVQGDNGGWQLQGQVLTGGSQDSAPQWGALVRQLGRLGQLTLLNARLGVYPREGSHFVVPYLGVSLEGRGERQKLIADIRLPDGSPLQVSVQARLDESGWERSEFKGFVSVPGGNWLQWLPADWQGTLGLQEAGLAAKAWFEASNGRLERAVLQAGQGRLTGRLDDRLIDITVHQLQAAWQDDGHQRQLWLPVLDLSPLPDVRVTPGSLMLRQLPAGGSLGRVTLDLQQLELAPVLSTVLEHVPMPQQAQNILRQLNFQGSLANTRVSWEPDQPWQTLAYDTNVRDMHYQHWEDVPGASGINGRLSGTLAGGELLLDSDDFSLHLHSLFATPWTYHKANARLTWSLSPDFDFELTSPYLQVRGEEGDLAGDFVIHLPRRMSDSYMDLRVGMRDGDAAFAARYLPRILQQDQVALWDWLHQSIRGGKVNQGYFQYQGSLAAAAPERARSISLFFDVEQAQLAYQPGWPAIEQGKARIYVHDDGVEVELDHGQVLQSTLQDAVALVRYAPPGQTTRLKIKGNLQSNVVDALYILQQTPLASSLPALANWRGEGELPVTLELDIALEGEGDVQARVETGLKNARLALPDQDLDLRQLHGTLSVDTETGITATGLQGRFLEQPFKATLAPTGAAGSWGIQLKAEGSMPVDALGRWLKQPGLPLAGNFAYRLALDVQDNKNSLHIDSDLQGLSIELPYPLAKGAREPVPSRFVLEVREKENQLSFSHGRRLQGMFTVPLGQQPWRGELVLDERLPRRQPVEGLTVRGRLPRLDLEQWQRALARLQEHTNEISEPGLSGLELDVGQLDAFGLVLNNLKARLAPQNRRPDAWLLQLDGQQVNGRVELYRQHPMVVELSRLQLPMPAADTDLAAQTAGLKTSDIPDMDVTIERLSLGDEVLGRWRFASRGGSENARFTQLDLDLKGLRIAGDLHWQQKPGQSGQTRFQGGMSGSNLADVLQAWGFAPSMSSERFSAGLNVAWPGNPADFALAGLDGHAEIKARKGQLTAVDGSAQVLKIFGLLNFDAIGRRLRLDFKDLWGRGLAYDRLDGRFEIRRGVYRSTEPLTIEGVSSNLALEGELDVPAGRIKADLQVAIPLTRNLTFAALVAGAPVVGGALFVIDRLSGDRLSRMAAVRYHISGNWDDPVFTLGKGRN